MLQDVNTKSSSFFHYSTIKAMQVEYYQVPLAEALADAKHGVHTHFELIICRIICSDDIEGVGYTYTGGCGGKAIYSLLQDELKDHLIGKDSSNIRAIWEDINWKLHYIGRGGLVSFAQSAIDIALWDIRCQRACLPLWRIAGGAASSVLCYAGGIDLNFSQEKLLTNISGYLDAGFEAVKIKVGKENYKEDVTRVAAVRDLIGDERTFMVDANYSMGVEHAIRFGKKIEKYDIAWFEEPTIPDDFEGYGRIAQAIAIPLAMGENLHTIHEFTHAINYSKLGFLQPDASNIGGITGWLNIANLAYANNLSICSHGMHELHVSLMASQPHAGFLEVHSFPIDKYTTQPIQLENGRALVPNSIGTGVTFDPDLLNQHLVLKK